MSYGSGTAADGFVGLAASKRPFELGPSSNACGDLFEQQDSDDFACKVRQPGTVMDGGPPPMGVLSQWMQSFRIDSHFGLFFLEKVSCRPVVRAPTRSGFLMPLPFKEVFCGAPGRSLGMMTGLSTVILIRLR